MYTTYIIFHSAVTMSVKDVTISSTEIRILLLVVLLLVGRIQQFIIRRHCQLGEGHGWVKVIQRSSMRTARARLRV